MPETEMFVSQSSLLEMALKLSIGWLQSDLPRNWSARCHCRSFRWLPIRNDPWAGRQRSGDRWLSRRDPFDRWLVGQSRVEQLLLPSQNSEQRNDGATR